MDNKDILIALSWVTIVVGIGFNLYGFYRMASAFEDIFYNLSYYFNSVSSIIINLFGLVGLIHYANHKDIHHRGLKAFLIYASVSVVLNTLSFDIYFRFFGSYVSFEVPWYSYVFKAISIGVLVFSIIVYRNENNKKRLKNMPVRKAGVRLGNYFIDAIFLNIFTLRHAMGMFDGGGEEIAFAVFFVLFTNIFYFTFSEFVFGQTIGKVLTNSFVGNAKGGRASFGQTIGRTFARWIPFEQFSFLGTEASGWHDSITGTNVFYESFEEPDEEDEIMRHLLSDEDDLS